MRNDFEFLVMAVVVVALLVLAWRLSGHSDRPWVSIGVGVGRLN